MTVSGSNTNLTLKAYNSSRPVMIPLNSPSLVSWNMDVFQNSQFYIKYNIFVIKYKRKKKKKKRILQAPKE